MSPARKGPVSQRSLVVELKALIDAARAEHPSAHRDMARAKLRAMLETTNWRTAYVANNLSVKRCRYLASIGYWVDSKFLHDEWHGKVEQPEEQE